MPDEAHLLARGHHIHLLLLVKQSHLRRKVDDHCEQEACDGDVSVRVVTPGGDGGGAQPG